MAFSRATLLSLISLLAITRSIYAEGEFMCQECNCEAGDKCPAYTHRTCTKEKHPDQWHGIQVACRTKVCYLVFGHEKSWRDFLKIGFKKYRFWELGCVQEGDADADPNTPQSYPVYSPLPPPDALPREGEFLCRWNEKLTGRHYDSISCFCFTSNCQSHINEEFYAKMRGELEYTMPPRWPSGWSIVDKDGKNAREVGQWKPVEFPPVKPNWDDFWCGACPCKDGAGGSCHSDMSRNECPQPETPFEYTIQQRCPQRQCYFMFGDKKGVFKNYRVVSKGCANMVDDEARDYNTSHGTPLYFAYPVPAMINKWGGFVCRRNRPNYQDFVVSISCFCYQSNCQSAANPDHWEFVKNLIIVINETQNDNYVYLDSHGIRVPGEPWPVDPLQYQTTPFPGAPTSDLPWQPPSGGMTAPTTLGPTIAPAPTESTTPYFVPTPGPGPDGEETTTPEFETVQPWGGDPDNGRSANGAEPVYRQGNVMLVSRVIVTLCFLLFVFNAEFDF